MQVHDELTDLRWQRLASFSCSTLRSRGEQTLHPVAFKLIRFASQRTLWDINFFGSLTCSFVEKEDGSDLFIEFLFRPQRPLLDIGPFICPLSAIAFRPWHLSCLSLKRRLLQAYLTSRAFTRI